MRDKRFACVLTEEEGRELEALAARLARSRSDTVRYLIRQAQGILDRDTAEEADSERVRAE